MMAGRGSRASNHAGKPHGARAAWLRAGGAEEGKDAFVGNLPEVALEVGGILGAVGYVVVFKDSVLQVVELV